MFRPLLAALALAWVTSSCAPGAIANLILFRIL